MTELYLLLTVVVIVLYLLRAPILEAIYWHWVASAEERRIWRDEPRRSTNQHMQEINEIMKKPLVSEETRKEKKPPRDGADPSGSRTTVTL